MTRKQFECWFVVGWLAMAMCALSESMWTFSKAPAKSMEPAEPRARAYGPNGEELQVEELPPPAVMQRVMSETI